MLKATLKGVLARKVRLLLSLIAVALSVAFVAGTFMFTGGMQTMFDKISAGTVADVNVQPKVDANQNGDVPPDIPADLVKKVAAVEGVERADGSLFGMGAFLIGRNNKMVGGTGAPTLVGNWTGAPAQKHQDMMPITEGRAPQADDEVVIDPISIKKGGYKVGDTVKVIGASQDKPQEYKLVGTFDMSSGGYAGATVLLFTTAQTQKLIAEGKDVFNGIGVTVRKGESQRAVADRVKRVVPKDSGLDVLTGDQAADQASSTIRDVLKPMTIFLLVFAGVALVVGAFLILNTFSMIVAQRIKEMALYRAMGASRGQVMRSVLLEALVTGLVGATVGLLLGWLLAVLLALLISALGMEMSLSNISLTPTAIIASYLVGVLVTLVAAAWPAWKASRIAPVRAMSNTVQDEARLLSVASIVGMVLGLGGAGLLAWSLADDGARMGDVNRQGVLGLGMLLLVVACAILAPLLGRPILAAMGWLYRKLFGPVGKMAETNAVRAPGRTAATAAALMIGVTLVVGVGMLATSFKASFNSQIDKVMSSDYIIQGPPGTMTAFSPTIGQKAAQIDGVEWAAAGRGIPAQVKGQQTYLVAMDADSALKPFDRKVVSGDAAAFSGPDTALVSKKGSEQLGVRSGDTIDVKVSGKGYRLKVVAEYSEMEGVGGGLTVSRKFLAKIGQPNRDDQLFVHPKAGADTDRIRQQLDALVADNPTVGVSDSNDFKKMMGGQMDMMLAMIYGLLGLAIIISILGIINTLGLSVVERTREIGLLRAIGLSRTQTRRMINLESIVISLLGAVMGLGLGLLAGYALLSTMKSQGITVIQVPWGTVVAMIIASLVVGALAALWPAWRASRQNVLEAIASE